MNARITALTLSLSMLAVSATAQEDRAPRAMDRAANLVQATSFGITSPLVGQGLRIGWNDADGVLSIGGGQAGSVALVLVGFERTYIPFEQGDAIRVLPAAVFAAGRFDENGQASMRIAHSLIAMAGQAIHVQAVEYLFIDLYPWSIHTSAGLSLTFVARDAAERRAQSKNATDRDGGLTADRAPSDADRMDASDAERADRGASDADTDRSADRERIVNLLIMDTAPPTYAIEVILMATQSQSLRFDWMDRNDEGTNVYLTLVEGRDPLEAGAASDTDTRELKPVRGHYFLEGVKACEEVRVFLASAQAGAHYLIPPPYEQIASFQTPCASH